MACGRRGLSSSGSASIIIIARKSVYIALDTTIARRNLEKENVLDDRAKECKRHRLLLKYSEIADMVLRIDGKQHPALFRADKRPSARRATNCLRRASAFPAKMAC